uniref:Major capsid protein L1 n=4 Tax=Epsilonpapillomavirus 1 TaxID=40537 RepID=VL1_BPV5|nr:RecName: Full=Major capsid protein L1 [Bos taurus papillomavirus 5]CAF05676.1 L1 protein [Epsilonpapillomavirus 1]
MAVWQQQGQRLYFPPNPVTKVLCTESYVKRTSIFYHGETERLLTVGHPYWKIPEQNIPKVSGNQYRVFRVQLPDPNQFALPDKNLHNPAKERLVWAILGLQVSRGQPLGAPVTGNQLFNVWTDAENVTAKRALPGSDDRKQLGMDVKQTQMLLIGQSPAIGEYWGKAIPCEGKQPKAGDCPPIELKNKPIEDGDMMDIGFGACDWKDFSQNLSDVPLDLINSKSLYPDYLKMAEDSLGNSCFFYARREQVYVRHVYSRGGEQKEAIPKDMTLPQQVPDNKDTSFTFMGTPSGSLVSTDGQLFNRPYWLYQAQGLNNGVCWDNELFITVGDNSRGGVFTISVPVDDRKPEQYNSANMNIYCRHVEEYKLAVILELCSVELTSETVAYLQTVNPSVLEKWEVGVNPPPATVLEDTYRYQESKAIKCIDQTAAAKKDKYENLSFWNIDLREKLSADLDQYPLGRRFLAQNGITCSRKRLRPASTKKSTTNKKRKTSR